MKRMGWFLWLLMAALLYVFENNTGTRVLLITSAALLFCSWVLAGFSSRRMVCTIEVPDAIPKGSECTLVIRAERMLPLTLLRVGLYGENLFTGEHWQQTFLLHGSESRIMLCSDHAGPVVLTSACRAVCLPGFSAGKEQLAAASVLVRPVFASVETAAAFYAEGEADQAVKRAASGEHSPELRTYQPGDPVRNIHWKLSQKLDRLMVREPEQQTGDNLRLSLDASDVCDADQLDGLTDHFLSSSMQLTLAGRQHEAVWLSPEGAEQRFAVDSEADVNRLAETLLHTGVSVQHAPSMPDAVIISADHMT